MKYSQYTQPPQKLFERSGNCYSSGGFLYVDTPETIALQRRVLTEVVKNLGKSLLSGRSLTTVSIPVIVFEPRSYLQRLADGWWSAPIFLHQAAATDDPVERLKLVISFVIAGFHNTCAQLKPFNPILGETYEAVYEDGTRIYCEQSLHHPPITNWQVFGPNDEYKFYGYGEWTASFSFPNTVVGQQKGPNYIEFKDGTVITYGLPVMNVTGILAGDRYVEYVGAIHFRDEKNNLRCDIAFGPKEGGWGGWFARRVVPSDYFRGVILQLPHMETLQEPSLINNISSLSEDLQNADVVCDIQGSWLGCIEFGDERTWDFQNDYTIYRAIPIDNPLPSDCRFREDLQWLAQKDLEKSQEWKSVLEEKQRAEARLRVEGANIRKKNPPQKRQPRILRAPRRTQNADGGDLGKGKEVADS